MWKFKFNVNGEIVQSNVEMIFFYFWWDYEFLFYLYFGYFDVYSASFSKVILFLIFKDFLFNFSVFCIWVRVAGLRYINNERCAIGLFDWYNIYLRCIIRKLGNVTFLKIPKITFGLDIIFLPLHVFGGYYYQKQTFIWA